MMPKALFNYPRSFLSNVREHLLRRQLGIPYVRSIRAGAAFFDFIIANTESYQWFSRDIDYTHIEGVATAYFSSRAIPGSIIVDVGAHHGFYTLLSASLLCGKGMVAAFEANRANFKVLRRNIKLNFFTNVRSYCVYVGDSNVKHCCRLDEVLAGLKPALIKIDVEGAELKVLNGTESLIDRARPDFMCELHPMKGADIGGIVTFFRSRSYRLFISREKNPAVMEELLPDSRPIIDNDILLAQPAAVIKP